MKVKRKINVVVIGGGFSSEREISLQSSKQVVTALKDLYRISFLQLPNSPRRAIETLLKDKRLRRADLAFLALHGKFGEDGTIQAILDTLRIPYTGSGVFASSLAMDKIKTNNIVSRFGVHVPSTTVLRPGGSLPNNVKIPCVVKPSKSGSSVGVTLVKRKADLPSAVRMAFREDNEILIQEYIQGREFTCGVYGNTRQTRITALPPVEIISSKTFFDYEAKYNPLKSQEICPAPLDAKKTKTLQSLAVRAHEIVGCRGLTRSDFILRGNTFYFLEINTIPGLTENSLCPKEAKAAGMSFREFLKMQIGLAMM